MDGVLVDTHDMIWTSINKVLSRYGVTLNNQEINTYLGKSLEDNIKSWNEKYSLNLNLQEYTPLLWAEQRKLLRNIGPDKNLVNLLNELEANNIPKGVGTSSQRFRARKILNWSGLRKYFPVLVASENVQNHKPAPDTFLEVAKLLSTPPENCIVIEDSYSGILAAKVAKMRAIGYGGKHNSLNDLVDADLVIKDFSELNYKRLSWMFNKDFKLNNHAFSPNTTGEKMFE